MLFCAEKRGKNVNGRTLSFREGILLESCGNSGKKKRRNRERFMAYSNISVAKHRKKEMKKERKKEKWKRMGVEVGVS
jgi:hypothetical protein